MAVPQRDKPRGSPGKTIKAAWRREGRPGPLREFAKLVYRAQASEVVDAWFDSKRPGGPAAQREARRKRRSARQVRPTIVPPAAANQKKKASRSDDRGR